MNSRVALALISSIVLSGCAWETSDVSEDAEELAASDGALCKNALTPVQQKLALQLIDDICGDTWCEGDNDFAFDRLTCHAASRLGPSGGSCKLELRIIPRDDSHRSYPRTCTTASYSGFDSLVDSAASGYQSLDWDYYLALTECISRLESSLPH